MDTIKSNLTRTLTTRNESMRAGNDFKRNKTLWALNTNKHLADCRSWYRRMGPAYTQRKATKEMVEILAKARAMEVCIQKYTDHSTLAHENISSKMYKVVHLNDVCVFTICSASPCIYGSCAYHGGKAFTHVLPRKRSQNVFDIYVHNCTFVH